MGKYERELVNSLTAAGIPSLRAPSSGGGTDRVLPDIIAGMSRPADVIESRLDSLVGDRVSKSGIENAASLLAPAGNVYGIELKSQSGTTLYVSEDEVRKLKEFCSAFGAVPRLGARFTDRSHPTEFYLIDPDDARITDSGNYGLPVRDIEERASEIIYPDTTTQEIKIEFEDPTIPTQRV